MELQGNTEEVRRVSENERTKKKGKCLAVMLRDGKAIGVVRCARLEECKRAMEASKDRKWKCPGYVEDRKAQVDTYGLRVEEEEKKDASQE